MATNGNGKNGGEDKIGKALDSYLTKHPDADNAALRAEAEKVDSAVSKLPGRTFNARYALQSRRRLGLTGKKKVAKVSGAKPRRGTNATATKGSKPRKTTSVKATPKRTSTKPPKVYASSPRAKGTSGTDTQRTSVRKTLITFAKDLAKNPVDAIDGIDGYVSKLMKATA